MKIDGLTPFRKASAVDIDALEISGLKGKLGLEPNAAVMRALGC